MVYDSLDRFDRYFISLFFIFCLFSFSFFFSQNVLFFPFFVLLMFVHSNCDKKTFLVSIFVATRHRSTYSRACTAQLLFAFLERFFGKRLSIHFFISLSTKCTHSIVTIRTRSSGPLATRIVIIFDERCHSTNRFVSRQLSIVPICTEAVG